LEEPGSKPTSANYEQHDTDLLQCCPTVLQRPSAKGRVLCLISCLWLGAR